MTLQPAKVPRFLFPPWANKIPALSVAILGFVATAAGFLIWYYFSPKHTDVGYAPKQPVPYSHKLHAGDLAMDCRYCHINVDRSWHASIPANQVCMNCHANVKKDSPALAPVRRSAESGEAVPWLRIHKLGDYAYFPHHRHVNRGVGCVECHGRIDQMVVVKQNQPLSMGWCLECHRDPAPHLRPLDKITKMDWPAGDPTVPTGAAERAEYQRKLAAELKIAPPTDCSRCHR